MLFSAALLPSAQTTHMGGGGVASQRDQTEDRAEGHHDPRGRESGRMAARRGRHLGVQPWGAAAGHCSSHHRGACGSRAGTSPAGLVCLACCDVM